MGFATLAFPLIRGSVQPTICIIKRISFPFCHFSRLPAFGVAVIFPNLHFVNMVCVLGFPNLPFPFGEIVKWVRTEEQLGRHLRFTLPTQRVLSFFALSAQVLSLVWWNILHSNMECSLSRRFNEENRVGSSFTHHPRISCLFGKVHLRTTWSQIQQFVRETMRNRPIAHSWLFAVVPSRSTTIG